MSGLTVVSEPDSGVQVDSGVQADSGVKADSGVWAWQYYLGWHRCQGLVAVSGINTFGISPGGIARIAFGETPILIH